MRYILATLAAAVAAAAAPAQTVLFDSNGFEAPGYTTGNLIGQNGWVLDTNNATSYTVQTATAAGGSGQAVAVTGGSGTNWAFPPLDYTPTAGQIVRIQSDIARTTPSATPSFGYSIDVYSPTTRTTRFGLAASAGTIRPYVTAPFNTTTGQFEVGQPVANVLVGAAVAANTFVNFDAQLDYTAKSYVLLINGVSVGSIPFADPTATTLSDADFQISTTTGATDSGFLDNYRVTVIAPVPEPATCGLAAFGAAAFALRRSRVRRA